MYDIFLVGRHNIAEDVWNNVKSRFPNAQRIDNCQDFKQISSKSFTKMFWVIWDDLVVNEDFDLVNYRATKWDDSYVHVFLNGENRDGICLFPKSMNISKREFDNRYFIIKKEIDVVASTPIQQIYDIVFISYNEPTANDNFENLKKRFPRAKRVHGVKGIHQAHIAAALIAESEMFYVVDGDAVIIDNFNFDYVVPKFERNHVHVWRSINPINDLEYGYGGVKLLPREKTIAMDVNTADMTTSISNNFKAMSNVSNTTAFNTDPFNTWKSAFRECVKLSSRIIARQDDAETVSRLDTWCTAGADRPFGEYAIAGAIAGKTFGTEKQNAPQELIKINDFKWLEDQFNGI